MWGRYTHDGVRQSVPAEIIRALGKGCLATTAGLIIGLVVGTLHLPTASFFIIAAAGAIGVACLTGSATLKGIELTDQHGEERQQFEELISMVKTLHAELPIENPERHFVKLVQRQRERSERTGRGI